MGAVDFDEVADREFWLRYEARLSREDREFDLRRYEPLEGFGRVFRADENVEEAEAA